MRDLKQINSRPLTSFAMFHSLVLHSLPLIHTVHPLLLDFSHTFQTFYRRDRDNQDHKTDPC